MVSALLAKWARYMGDLLARCTGAHTQVNRETNNGIQSFDLSYNDKGQVTAIDYPNHSRRRVEYDALGVSRK